MLYAALGTFISAFSTRPATAFQNGETRRLLKMILLLCDVLILPSSATLRMLVSAIHFMW
jgi:hypothetical protein